MLQTRVAEEPSPYKLHRLAGEVSRFNPAAVRGPHGIWNEETLPVLEWKAPEYRMVVPIQLQRSLVLNVPPVLRWATKKLLDVIAKHHVEPMVVADLTRLLDGWAFHGEETAATAETSASCLRTMLDGGTRSVSAPIGVEATTQ